MRNLYIIKLFLVTIVFFLVGGVFLHIAVHATNIRLGIYNSYQGYITVQPGENIVQRGGITWTDENILGIRVGADTGSSYTITGNNTNISSIGSGIYQDNYDIILESVDGSDNLYGLFMRQTEPYITTLNLMIDRSNPSIPLLLQPSVNSIMSGNVNFSRSPSIDNGVGISHYRVHLSVNAGFLGETVITTSGNILQINANDLPIGILFWYVEAIDYLGHTSSSLPSSFQQQIYSIIDNNSSGNGGGGGFNINTGNQNINTGNQNINTGNQNINTGSIVQSGSIINNTVPGNNNTVPGNNNIITKPEEENNNISIFSGNTVDNNMVNDTTINTGENPKTINTGNLGSESSPHNKTYNYMIVSNSIHDNNPLSLKEYLVNTYHTLLQKGNLILPYQNNITIEDGSLNKILYNNFTQQKKITQQKDFIQEPWIYKPITYVVQQKNPVYYIVQIIKYSLIFIENIAITLGL